MDILENYEHVTKKIYFMYLSGFINNGDIERLVNSNINDVISNIDTYKDSILFSIYINPYLLSNDYLLELDYVDFNLISRLIIKRYNEEITEYNNLFVNGDISYKEYYNNVMKLNNLYFNSTKVGNRISTINCEDIVGKFKKK